jgi:hypothetical protein
VLAWIWLDVAVGSDAKVATQADEALGQGLLAACL